MKLLIDRSDRLRSQYGFSLIELLVVIVILGILTAIAIPSFTGAKAHGYDTQAQSALRSALAAERTYYVDHQQYTAVQADLRKIEPNVTFSTTDGQANGAMVATQNGVNGATTFPNAVTVVVGTSRSEKQFCIMNIAQDLTVAVNGQTLAGTYYALKATPVTPPSTSASINSCGTTGYNRSEAAVW